MPKLIVALFGKKQSAWAFGDVMMVINPQVRSADLKARPKKAETGEGTYCGKTVVPAAGANSREFGVSTEREPVCFCSLVKEYVNPKPSI